MPASATEQYLLELINDARLDPMGDAARYISSYGPVLTARTPNIQSAFNQFRVDGSQLLSAFQALTPAQPVAFSDVLAGGAAAHNGLMIAADVQSHQVTSLGEASLGPRLSNEGYSFLAAGENVYAYSYDMLYAQAGFMVDWGGSAATGGMQNPAGHRVNEMNATYREVGVAVTDENNPATAVGPEVITEDFGTRGNAGVFLLGVAYNDYDRDGFYSIGEGVGGLNVSLPGAWTSSAAAGGYTLQSYLTGYQTAVLSGGGLAGTVSVGLNLYDGLNAKLDVVNGQMLRTSISAVVSGAVSTVQALGVQSVSLTIADGVGRTLLGNAGGDALAGSSGDDTLVGGAGNDVLDAGGGTNWIDGGGGDNTISFAFASSAATVTHSGSSWRVDSGSTHDVISNVQHFRFTDGTVSDLGSLGSHDVRFTDTMGGMSGSNVSDAYSGPVGFLQHQYIWSSGDDVAISAGAPNTFLKGGSGRDALMVTGGSNVLDGGAGSNFLVGSTGGDGGVDTFFVDERGGQVTWSTIVNFHPGDYATIFGFHAGTSTRPMTDGDGAAGFSGVTIHSEINGAGTGVLGSMTFAGIDRATADAHFQYSTGVQPGNVEYLMIHYV